MSKTHKRQVNRPFAAITQSSLNFWNRYESWREYYFQRPADIGYKAPPVCEVCGKPGDKSHIAQKCCDDIVRCNRCRSYARPDDFWFKLNGYQLFSFPQEPIQIKDETNDVVW